MTSPATRPTFRARVALALAITAVTFVVAYWLIHRAQKGGGDFTWPWRAARALRAGQDPYAVIQPRGEPYPYDAPFKYPLAAAFAALPFSWLTVEVAAAAFMAVSVGLATFAVTRESYAQLPFLASPPISFAIVGGQWSPLIVAAALLPLVQGVAVAKPNLGLAAFAYRPTRTGVLLALALLAISFVVVPGWVPEWRDAVATSTHYLSALSSPAGWPLVLALLRWRRPEARLLFVMACVPQTWYSYDQLPLWLVPLTLRESLSFSVLAYGAVFLPPFLPPQLRIEQLWVTIFFYLPCLVMVLRRPNEGELPVWLERRVPRRWATGRAETA